METPHNAVRSAWYSTEMTQNVGERGCAGNSKSGSALFDSSQTPLRAPQVSQTPGGRQCVPSSHTRGRRSINCTKGRPSVHKTLKMSTHLHLSGEISVVDNCNFWP